MTDIKKADFESLFDLAMAYVHPWESDAAHDVYIKFTETLFALDELPGDDGIREIFDEIVKEVLPGWFTYESVRQACKDYLESCDLRGEESDWDALASLVFDRIHDMPGLALDAYADGGPIDDALVAIETAAGREVFKRAW